MKLSYHKLVAFTLCVIVSYHSYAAVPQAPAGSLFGTVTDISGALIPNARVWATLRNSPTAHDPVVFETETDQDGRFMLKKLPAGVYTVRAGVAGSEAQIARIVSVPEGKAVKLAIELSHACEQGSETAEVITGEDKAEVLRLTLAQAVRSKLLWLDKKQIANGVILATQNIEPEWVKNVSGIKITLMAQKQIQTTADRDGDFLFLSFSEFRAKGNCIVLTLVNTWAIGKHSKTVYLSGSAHTFEYRKQSGKWVGKLIGGWVS